MGQLRFSDWVSFSALILSAISFFTTFFFKLCDKARLRAFSVYYPPHEWNHNATLTIRIVNHGNRDAFLRTFGGDCKNGQWNAEFLKDKDSALILPARQSHEIIFTKEKAFDAGVYEDTEYIDLWFEDSLGKRHYVKNAKEHLIKLKQT